MVIGTLTTRPHGSQQRSHPPAEIDLARAGGLNRNRIEPWMDGFDCSHQRKDSRGTNPSEVGLPAANPDGSPPLDAIPAEAGEEEEGDGSGRRIRGGERAPTGGRRPGGRRARRRGVPVPLFDGRWCACVTMVHTHARHHGLKNRTGPGSFGLTTGPVRLPMLLQGFRLVRLYGLPCYGRCKVYRLVWTWLPTT